MNIIAHIMIATQIFRYANIKTKMNLNLPAFVFGNIWPDLDRRLSGLPHDFDSNSAEVCQMAEQAVGINTEGPYFNFLKKSFKLGIICHLLSDFNCFAHSRQFTGQLWQHYSYEFKMLFHLWESRKIKIYRSALSWKQQESFRVFLNKAQDLYRRDSVEYASDLAHAINTSTIVTTRLARRNQVMKAHEPASATLRKNVEITI